MKEKKKFVIWRFFIYILWKEFNFKQIFQWISFTLVSWNSFSQMNSFNYSIPTSFSSALFLSLIWKKKSYNFFYIWFEKVIDKPGLKKYFCYFIKMIKKKRYFGEMKTKIIICKNSSNNHIRYLFFKKKSERKISFCCTNLN